MVYIDVDSGGFSNRILLIAHSVATALERGENITTNHYSDLRNDIVFHSEHLDTKIIFREYTALDKLMRFPETHLRKQYTYNNEYAFSEQAFCRHQKSIVIGSWYFRNFNALKKYHAECKQFLDYKSETIERAVQMFGSWKKDYDIVIGIHVRRGDYEQWQDGRFFYSHEQYYTWLMQIKEELKEKYSKIGVFICSNEPMPNEWKESDVFWMPDATLYEDQYCLSECDYIMGPPSTFSWWAAFRGERPYCVIYDSKQNVSIDDFSTNIVMDYNYLSKNKLLNAARGG